MTVSLVKSTPHSFRTWTTKKLKMDRSLYRMDRRNPRRWMWTKSRCRSDDGHFRAFIYDRRGHHRNCRLRRNHDGAAATKPPPPNSRQQLRLSPTGKWIILFSLLFGSHARIFHCRYDVPILPERDSASVVCRCPSPEPCSDRTYIAIPAA